MIEAHGQLKKGSWFAGSLWTWMGPAPHNAYSMDATEKAVHSCRERLDDYVEGRLDHIEELETELLFRFGTTQEDRHAIDFNSWSRSITAGVIG